MFATYLWLATKPWHEIMSIVVLNINEYYDLGIHGSLCKIHF